MSDKPTASPLDFQETNFHCRPDGSPTDPKPAGKTPRTAESLCSLVDGPNPWSDREYPAAPIPIVRGLLAELAAKDAELRAVQSKEALRLDEIQAVQMALERKNAEITELKREKEDLLKDYKTLFDLVDGLKREFLKLIAQEAEKESK